MNVQELWLMAGHVLKEGEGTRAGIHGDAAVTDTIVELDPAAFVATTATSWTIPHGKVPISDLIGLGIDGK